MFNFQFSMFNVQREMTKPFYKCTRALKYDVASITIFQKVLYQL